MWFKQRFIAPGPTPQPESTRLIQARSLEYHRTAEFSRVIGELSAYLQRLLETDWPVIPVAATGTGGMQMAVLNTVSPGDTVLVVDSGKFGRRWVELLEAFGCNIIVHRVERGQAVDPRQFRSDLLSARDVKAVFLTMVETSTLVRHPIEKLAPMIAELGPLVVVDAISGLGAEPFSPETAGVDLVVGGSQKALMAPPGLAFLAVGPRVVEALKRLECPVPYFDLARALDRFETGSQTVWTPPISLLRAVLNSLQEIFHRGPHEVYRQYENLATICRSAVVAAGLEIFSSVPSVVGTAVKLPDRLPAKKIHDYIYKNCKLYIPYGQEELQQRILRIGHLGDVDYFDLLAALSALELSLVKFGYKTRPGTMLKTAQEVAGSLLDS